MQIKIIRESLFTENAVIYNFNNTNALFEYYKNKFSDVKIVTDIIDVGIKESKLKHMIKSYGLSKALHILFNYHNKQISAAQQYQDILKYKIGE